MTEENGDLTPPSTVNEPEVEQKKPRRAARGRSATPKLKKYRANKFPIYHPYQEKTVPVSGYVEMVPDNWVEVQVRAGVIIDMGKA